MPAAAAAWLAGLGLLRSCHSTAALNGAAQAQVHHPQSLQVDFGWQKYRLSCAVYRWHRHWGAEGGCSGFHLNKRLEVLLVSLAPNKPCAHRRDKI